MPSDRLLPEDGDYNLDHYDARLRGALYSEEGKRIMEKQKPSNDALKAACARCNDVGRVYNPTIAPGQVYSIGWVSCPDCKGKEEATLKVAREHKRKEARRGTH